MEKKDNEDEKADETELEELGEASWSKTSGRF